MLRFESKKPSLSFQVGVYKETKWSIQSTIYIAKGDKQRGGPQTFRTLMTMITKHEKEAKTFDVLAYCIC